MLFVLRLVTEANGGRKMKGMIWTNRMTENEIETYLPKEDYIIHVSWFTKNSIYCIAYD